MADQKAFTFALYNLLQPQRECEAVKESFMDSMKKEFQWMDEIFEAACSAFTVNSKKLEPMPKTPCVKNKMQKRKRKKEEAYKAELESTPTSSKARCTAIKFEPNIEDSEDSAETMTTGRPMRKCRASRNATKPAPRLNLRRQAKKEVEESSIDVETTIPEPSPEKAEQNNSLITIAGSKEASRSLCEGSVASTNTNTQQATKNGKTDESSPSVRTRVKNYEINIIERLTPTNQRSPRLATPKAIDEVHASSKLKSRPDSNPPLANQPSSTNKKKRSSSKKQEKEVPNDSPPPRQTRTRLRLHKQASKDEPEEESKMTKTGEETKVQKVKDNKKNDQNQTVHQHVTPCVDLDRDEADSGRNQRSSKGRSLSETQVVISEVYELYENGDEPKLQQYEVVKTKTTPVLNVSVDDLQAPSSPDLAASEESSSDTEASDAKESSRNEMDSNTPDNASKGMSTRTRTRVKQNGNVRADAPVLKTGENKDSGVGMRTSSEKANSTFTAESESGSDDGMGRSTRTRARQQKEKAAAVDAEVADPVRSTRTRQRAKEAEAAAAEASAVDGGPKRLVEHTRGMSPAPKRIRSNVGVDLLNMHEDKMKKLLEKQKKDEEKVNRLKELKKRKIEEKQREREVRFQRVAATRQEQEEKQRFIEEQMMKKLGTTAALKAKIQEEREKEEIERRKQRQKKQMEADLRRKQEEEERRRKRQEQEEEARQQEALFLKKRKQEELWRKQKMAEEKAKNEERLAEKEQKLMEEKARVQQMQRDRDLMNLKAKLDKENQLLQERMERERIEKEKKAEREKKIKEEMERLKAMEQERLHLREQELQKQREIADKERAMKQIISNHNKSVLAQKQQKQSVEPPAAPTVVNTTQTLNTSKTLNPAVTNSNNYEMTPPKKYTSNDPHNYGLDDKESDDSTDEEDQPKKRIPEWAMGVQLNTALIRQCVDPPDVDKLFRWRAIIPPNLEEIFKGSFKRRYKERTSSAIWNTPPVKYC
ncbi:inner centromere protein [Plakobranchus ocellatus]|uniref:Inner centromere protein n=1 Tax=Plakobranchus ocellatus TaxID=259542 RepID=A0AAV4DE68_9GAST|nr:inner centromere protein [Plakobranchus ocellatus]